MMEDLQLFGIDYFVDKYKLSVCYHTSLPLAILSYTTKTKLINKTIYMKCRGMVIETYYPFRIVSKGFDTMDYNGNNEQIVSASIKEDGTLIFIFRYVNTWVLSTLHNFGDDVILDKSCTYKELFYENTTIQFHDFEFHDNVTLCFEMCCAKNRVIRNYANNTIFLLAIFYGNSFEHEFDIYSIDTKIHTVSIPIKYNIQNMSEAQHILDTFVLSEPLFEGLVIRSTTGRRIKLKNKNYLILHKLRYRNIPACTPEFMTEIILNNLDILAMQYLTCILDTYTLSEIQKRLHYYKTLILQTKYAVLAHIPEIREKNSIEFSCFLKNLFSLFSPYSSVHSIRKLYIELYKSNNGESEYENIWKKHAGFIFNKTPDPFICKTKQHEHKYCKYITTQHNNSNSMSNCPTICVCGNNMMPMRLKYDFTIYKTCHCNVDFGLLTYSTGTLLSICDKCFCTHEINPRTETPLGFPASKICKNMRLHVHQLINEIIIQQINTRQTCYEQIASVLCIHSDVAHISMCDYDMCKTLILYFQTILDAHHK